MLQRDLYEEAQFLSYLIFFTFKFKFPTGKKSESLFFKIFLDPSFSEFSLSHTMYLLTFKSKTTYQRKMLTNHTHLLTYCTYLHLNLSQRRTLTNYSLRWRHSTHWTRAYLFLKSWAILGLFLIFLLSSQTTEQCLQQINV